MAADPRIPTLLALPAIDGDILPALNYVCARQETLHRELETPDGERYVRSIMPYRTAARHIHGVVIVFRRCRKQDVPGNGEAAESGRAAFMARLTPRERQIVRFILAGHSNKRMAADLGISQRTVENHRANVMRKTGAKSLSSLFRLFYAGDSTGFENL